LLRRRSWVSRSAAGETASTAAGERQTGGEAKESVLATAFEAVLGVVYLEGGLDAARRVVGSLAMW
jgi:ribonuclease III